MSYRNSRRPQRRKQITIVVCGKTISADNDKHMVDVLEKQAAEADNATDRETFLQHAEHYIKEVNNAYTKSKN